MRFFDGIQIFTLDILNQGDLAEFCIIVFANQCGDFFQSGKPCAAQAPLTCDKFIPIMGKFSHKHGL